MAVLNQRGHVSMVVTGAAANLTIPDGLRPKRALVQVLDNPIRYRMDGVDPTPASGHFKAVGDEIAWMGPEDEYDAWGVIHNVAFITDQNATGDARLEVSLYD